MKKGDKIKNTYTNKTYVVKTVLDGMVAIYDDNLPEITWFDESDASLLGFNVQK